MEVTRTGVLLVLFCLCLCGTMFCLPQVTFSPDPDEEIQLQLTLLVPVEIKTVQCYSSSPRFEVQYVTVDGNQVVYNISNYYGGPIHGDRCENSKHQYRIILNTLQFIADPVLVGGTFKLKATVDNSEENSTLSRRNYTFPAPFNLTGSSIRPVVNSSFTLTCHVTTEYPVIEWIKDSIHLVQVGIPYANGSCLTHQANASLNYKYDCQKPELTYTLTIPTSGMTKELQSSVWRCKDIFSELKGSKFMKLDIIVPVTTTTITPNNGSTITVDENKSVTFTCITNDAEPPPTILWFLDSSDITPQAGSNRATLTLVLNRAHHQMSVMCVAWNSGNTANLSASTALNVRSSAIFLTDQYSQVFHLNRKASIKIPFYCNPTVTMLGIEWMNKTDLNDKPVESSEIVSLSVVDDVDLALENTNATLRGQIAVMNIASVQRYHRGYYVVRIQNSASLVSSLGVMLDLSVLPDPPANLTVQCREDVAHLAWTSPAIYSSELSFHLNYKEEDEDTYVVLEKEYDNGGPSQVKNANIMNIKPKIVYHFKVASKNVHGLSEYTDTKTCVIFEDNTNTSVAGAYVGGVAGGITGVFLVLTAILIAVIVMRERRYRIEKGTRAQDIKASFDKYEDLQLPNTNNERGADIEHSHDERSTYEELQTSMDVHTYDHV